MRHWSLLFLCLLVGSSTANKHAATFQVYTMYQTYRTEVEAYKNDLSKLGMLCGDPANGKICTMKEYFEHVSRVKRQPKKDSEGKVIKDPETNKPIGYNIDVDFSKADWEAIDKDPDNLTKLRDELEKTGFKGAVINTKIFKGYTGEDSFDGVQNRFDQELADVRKHLKADIPETRRDNIANGLQAQANARRYDQAENLREAFEKDPSIKAGGFTPKFTDEIHRDYVEPYRQVDTEATLNSSGKDQKDIEKFEVKIRGFVKEFSNSKASLSHIAAIGRTEGSRSKVVNFCGEAKS